MFKLPAYDPIGMAIMGFGVVLMVALAFVFQGLAPTRS